MRWLLATAVALAAILHGVSGAAWAQAPPWNSYNSYRAYRHFLNSPYSYRTYSSATPGFAGEAYSPYGYRSYYFEPGYTHQRITPRGYESFSAIPGYGVENVTPFGGSGLQVPGYTRQYYAPAPRPKP